MDIVDINDTLNCGAKGGPKGSIPMKANGSIILEVVEGRCVKSKKNMVSSIQVNVDNTDKNFIFSRTHKCNER